MFCLVPLLTCLLSLVTITWADDVVVSTKYGQVRGETILSPRGKNLNRFLGIPFAKPPTGNRRFQPPSPPDSWSGVLDTRTKAVACPQPIVQGFNFTAPPFNEDCLYLNVYAPKTSHGSASLPVMVWIHGGAFYLGFAVAYDGGVLAEKDVIVVTINYRLGALGFLSTEDSEAPGNYGMLDQVMALQWVKDNIAHFGGNPSRVTIFGESAGSASVSLHLLSPLSRGLFQAAICESGVSVAPFAVNYPKDNPSPGGMASLLGAGVGCTANSSKDLVACLRTKSANDLISYDLSRKVQFGRLPWAPVVEKLVGFLPDTPLRILQRGNDARVPVIQGSNMDELGLSPFIAAIPGIESGLHPYFFNVLVREFVLEKYQRNQNEITELLINTYTKNINTQDPSAVRQAYIRMLSDESFTAPTERELILKGRRHHHDHLFAYIFAYRSPNSPAPQWQGVIHGDELSYVFGVPYMPHGSVFMNITWTDKDKAVSEAMMTMWTNFAKHGNPTPQPVDGVRWTGFTSNRHAYLSIDDHKHMTTSFRVEEMKVWNVDVPKLAINRGNPIVG